LAKPAIIEATSCTKQKAAINAYDGVLHEEESMGASDEDEHLRNNGNLDIDSGVQLLIIVVYLTRRGIRMDVELALEEV